MLRARRYAGSVYGLWRDSKRLRARKERQVSGRNPFETETEKELRELKEAAARVRDAMLDTPEGRLLVRLVGALAKLINSWVSAWERGGHHG